MLVYYSGLGFLVSRPSLDHVASKELTYNGYQGVFALSDHHEKEFLYTGKVSINYLELTNHKDAPDLSDSLNKLSTELEFTEQILTACDDIYKKNLVFMKEHLKNNNIRGQRVVLMLTDGWESVHIQINSEQKHYEIDFQGVPSVCTKLSILDEIPQQEMANKNKSEMLTAVNQASMKFWNNADKNVPDTWTTNQTVIN